MSDLALLDAGWETPLATTELDKELEGVAAIQAITEGSFPLLAIPVDFGGLGVALSGVAGAQRQIALRHPSAAIALNMHSLSVGVMAERWRHERDQSWLLLEGLANSHGLVASAFAEPNGSTNPLRSRCVARRSDAGFRVSGVKFPCSLATVARLFCITAEVEGDTIVALCPSGSPGLSVEAEWTSIGMRGSDTRRVVLDEVRVDDRLVFHRAPSGSIDDLVVSALVWFAVLLAATYHGVLSRLLQLAFVGQTPAGCHTTRLASACHAAIGIGAAARQLAALWERGGESPDIYLAHAAALRLQLSRQVDVVVAAVRPVLGGRVYTSGTESAALLLDLLAVHHHPPAMAVCETIINDVAAGRTPRLDP